MTTPNALPSSNTDAAGVSPTPPELLQDLVKAERLAVAGRAYEPNKSHWWALGARCRVF
jgi:hypothetical protein